MNWTIEVTKTAIKQLKKIDPVSQKRVIGLLKKLSAIKNPRLYGKALHGEKKELWRYRIGNYRIICDIQDQTLTILVIALGHRNHIYKQ